MDSQRKEQERTYLPEKQRGAKQGAHSRNSRPAGLQGGHLLAPYLFRLCLSSLPDVAHGHEAQDQVGQALFPVTLEELAVQQGHLFKTICTHYQLQG